MPRKAKPKKTTTKINNKKRTLPTCFVIMPFGQPLDRYFNNIFVPAVVDAGLDPIRADSLFRSTNIVGDIWRLTKNATVLLADLTGKNPNVFYELGLAHAIGKPVVLVSNTIDDVPFDLRSLRVLIYDKDDEEWGTRLQEGITKALKETIADLASAVPLPFLEQKPLNRPAEDPIQYELRRIWDQIRAIQMRPTASLSPQTQITYSNDPLPPQQHQRKILWSESTLNDFKNDISKHYKNLATVSLPVLVDAAILILEEKKIHAIKRLREIENIDLKFGKEIVDYMEDWLIKRGLLGSNQP